MTKILGTNAADVKDFVVDLVPQILNVGHWMALSQQQVSASKKTSSETPQTSGEVFSSKITETVTKVDLLVQEQLLQHIMSRYSNIMPFGEEDTAHNRHKDHQQQNLYITLDPLDGTYAYTQGKADYCTMLSLFSADKMLAGIIHFPGLNQTYVGICGDGLFQLSYTSSIEDPFATERLIFEPIAKPEAASSKKHIAVHYRLLKAPFLDQWQTLNEQQYQFETLFGDAEAATRATKLKGSNGQLIVDMLLGHSQAYIGPYTSYHDLLPLAGLVLSAGGTMINFVAEKAEENQWQRQNTQGLVASMLAGERRTRMILTLDETEAETLATLIATN